MDCIVMVEIADDDSPSDLLNSQRVLARELKSQGHCSDFLPVNRSAKPDQRVDCYLFDLTLAQDDIAARFQNAFKGMISVAVGDNSIQWQLARFAGQATEALLSDFWDDNTRQHHLVSYFVYPIVTTIGADQHLQPVFFANCPQLAEGNEKLSSIANHVDAILRDRCSNPIDRYRLFRFNFLHYVMNSLGKSSQQEYHEVSQWLDNEGIS